MLISKVVIYLLTYRLCESSTWPGNRVFAEGSFEREDSISGPSAENVPSTHFQGVDSIKENQEIMTIVSKLQSKTTKQKRALTQTLLKLKEKIEKALWDTESEYEHDEEGMNSQKQDGFSISIKKGTTYSQPMTYDHHDVYRYEVGVPVELICTNHIPSKSFLLQWMDQNGFSTAGHQKFKNNALKLKLTPDEYDVHFKLICISYYSHGLPRNITITLVPHPGNGTQHNPDTFPKAIKKKEPVVNNATCNSTVYYPDNITRPSPVIVRPNEKIIEEFENRFEGTVIYCYKYINFGCEGSPPIQTYERRKSITTLYLKHEFTTYSDDINVLSQNIAFNNEANVVNSSERNEIGTTAIVGGTLGLIILLLLITILVMWYRKTQRDRLLDDSAYHVVYAEIEERPSQQPPQLPPPRTEPPYAQIAGTLVPKQASFTDNTVKTPLYCIIK